MKPDGYLCLDDYVTFMIVNLLKPALRAEDIYDFAARQKKFLMSREDSHGYYEIVFPVWTSRRPARVNDLLNGGSVYWIIKKHITCRQVICDFVELEPEPGEENPSYLILCDPKLIRTELFPKRPFQGWRYLEPKDAPADIGEFDEEEERPPPEMEKDLTDLGLL